MDIELIRHIAALARIDLSPGELERLAPQLESIIRSTGFFRAKARSLIGCSASQTIYCPDAFKFAA